MSQLAPLFLRTLFQRIMISSWFLNLRTEVQQCPTTTELSTRIQKSKRECFKSWSILNALTMSIGQDRSRSLASFNMPKNVLASTLKFLKSRNCQNSLKPSFISSEHPQLDVIVRMNIIINIQITFILNDLT